MRRLSLEGVVDVSVVDDELARLLARVHGDSSPRIEIDCSNVTSIDASGLAMLIKLRTKTGKKIVLLNASERIRRRFVITELDRIIELHDVAPVQQTVVASFPARAGGSTEGSVLGVHSATAGAP
jgi:anti-anti-sigma factor